MMQFTKADDIEEETTELVASLIENVANLRPDLQGGMVFTCRDCIHDTLGDIGHWQVIVRPVVSANS